MKTKLGISIIFGAFNIALVYSQEYNKNDYLQLFLKNYCGVELDSSKTYNILMLHCEHCGNCDEKLKFNFKSFQDTATNIVILFSQHSIYQQLKNTFKNIIVCVDNKSMATSYGFGGISNLFLIVTKNKIFEEKILN